MRMRASAVLALVAAGACSKDPCEAAYEMERRCSTKPVDKELYLIACEAARKLETARTGVEATIACAGQDSCDAFRACGKAQRGKARAREVAQAIDAGAWKTAWDDCTLMADYYADEAFKAECAKVFATGATQLAADDAKRAMYRCRTEKELAGVAPAFTEACRAIASAQLAAATAAATAARDAGRRDFQVCFDLEQLAEMAGGAAALAEARALCKEVEHADDAKQAIDDARANLAAKKAEIPFGCQHTGDRLAELDTAWAKQRIDELFRACYVELGAVVLEVAPREARYVCPARVKRVQDAIGKHDLATRYPELAALVGKLPRTCRGK